MGAHSARFPAGLNISAVNAAAYHRVTLQTLPAASESDQQVALFIIGGSVAAAVLLLLLLAAALWTHHRRRQRLRHHSAKELQPLRQPRMPILRPDHPIALVMPTVSVSETGSEPISSDVSGLSQSSSSSSLAAMYSLSPLTSLDSCSVTEETTASALAASNSTGSGGLLGVRVCLDSGKQQLTVRVLAARRLPIVIRKGSSDPYVKLCVLPEKRERYTTRVVHNTVDPVFNEQFVFSVKKPAAQCPTQILRLTVCDFDKFVRRSLLGTALLPLSRLATSISAAKDSSYTAGCIDGASAEFWLPIEENSADQPSAREHVRGMIEVSLCHVSASRLVNVDIIRVKDLGIRQGSTVAVYVKMTWFERRRPIRTRKSRHGRLDAQQWMFGERMSVPLTDSSQLTSSCLALAVCARNRHGGRYTVGRCCVGPIMYSAGSSGVEQWNNMIHSPDQTISMWHKLA